MTVENVGRFAVGEVVSFNPRMDTSVQIPALVVRNYGTDYGKVLYDLALQYVELGHADFHRSQPICAVDSIYVGESNV